MDKDLRDQIEQAMQDARAGRGPIFEAVRAYTVGLDHVDARVIRRDLGVPLFGDGNGKGVAGAFCAALRALGYRPGHSPDKRRRVWTCVQPGKRCRWVEVSEARRAGW
jgi:hypothetical protein